jgi:hypothetical protein
MQQGCWFIARRSNSSCIGVVLVIPQQSIMRSMGKLIFSPCYSYWIGCSRSSRRSSSSRRRDNQEQLLKQIDKGSNRSILLIQCGLP